MSRTNFHGPKDVRAIEVQLYMIYSSYEPQRQKTYLRSCAPSDDSDQPTDLWSVIRIFPGRISDRQRCKVSSSEQRQFWSDCADAQADLSLCWAYMSEGTFSHVVAHMSAISTNIHPYCMWWMQCLLIYAQRKKMALFSTFSEKEHIN